METTQLTQEILELRSQGHSIRSIAAFLEIKKSKVEQTLNFYNVQTDSDSSNKMSEVQVDTNSVSFKGSRQGAAGEKSGVLKAEPTIKSNERLVFSHIQLLQTDFKEFVEDMSEIFSGEITWEYRTFIKFPKKADRFIKTIKLLCQQLGEESKSLLLIHILNDIRSSLLEALIDYEEGEDSDIHVEPASDHGKVEFWKSGLEIDFFEPLSY